VPPAQLLIAMSGDAATARGGGAPPAGAGSGAGAGAPGGGAVNDNNNGGNSASPSSGGPFSGYNLLFLFPLLALSLYVLYVLVPVLHDASSMLLRYCYVLVPVLHDASSMLLRYCYVPVPDIHDAHSMLLVMLRSPYTAYAMIIALTFWIKICRLMTIFPTYRRMRSEDR
jgi:hypothetical protein